jgi:hypothetical protein
MAPMWNDDESRRKAGRKHGNGNFMQGQDEMTLVPFHQVDDAEAGQCFEGKREALRPERRFWGGSVVVDRNEGRHVGMCRPSTQK